MARSSAHLQFGPVTLVPDERVLLRDGQPVALTPKAFDLLAFLATNPGRLLTKDEILQGVWPDAVVEESNLAYHVFAIRKALADGSDTNRYIETVPKRGYRFIAPVVQLSQTAGAAEISPPIQYVTTSDGVRIAFMSLGSGPPLLFASNIFGELTAYRVGWPGCREVTNRLVALGWRVIRYDVRGMGFSDRDVEDLSLEGRVRDLEAVVSHLGLERFALGGIDIGAATAISYTVNNHEALSALVLLSPWASGARYLQIPRLRAAYAAEPMAGDDPKLFVNILGSVATTFGDPDLVRLLAEQFAQTTTAAGLAAYNAASARIDITHLLPRVKVPTLVIHESSFPFGSYELCREVAAGIPGARFILVSENSIAGRMHDANVAAINGFLRSTAVGSRAPEGLATLPPTSDRLTARELQVLRLVAAGSSNKDTASALGVAVSTLERHLVNLYTKINARGRADAIAYALRHGLDSRE